ncbi:FitA-like ribbon-helix-helix domain-containing protein [Thiorhodovibrio winogradskyi]|uniref:FitA-like ribbon-helix-helix domain-containing protein n=1 Tax=Thiorhodovibrio winogradskyi TaxID=77007 RepID=UPI002E2D0DB3|nr:toxin-antitoxin system [Thiorhodovibrio winogradskyi]
MAQVIVRNLDNTLKNLLKKRAQRHGWSMEEEVRQILRRAMNEEPAPEPRLGSRIAARFSGIGLEAPLPEGQGQQIDPPCL